MNSGTLKPITARDHEFYFAGWNDRDATIAPRPIDDADKSEPILAYFGPEHAGWYSAYWNDQLGHIRPKPYWSCAEARYLGMTWVRANQPTVFVRMPPPPSKGDAK